MFLIASLKFKTHFNSFEYNRRHILLFRCCFYKKLRSKMYIVSRFRFGFFKNLGQPEFKVNFFIVLTFVKNFMRKY
jgi:hypothetical protein